ncbi:MAG: ABC transporter permease subunit [Phycisphaerales bacterium]|nr:MAG: ABC transporter permease subunit [Phycisphaerales bacterium]
MRGLIAKTLRETRFTIILLVLSLGAMEMLLAYILPMFIGEEYGQWLKVKFIRQFVTVMLGTEVGQSISPRMIAAIAWVHMMVLAIVFSQAIAFCTRVPAGEVDRGTVDCLLALPVSRKKLYLCESLVWLLAGMLTVLIGLAGNAIGGRGAPEEMKMTWRQSLIVITNLYCLYLAVGGITWLVSSLSDRRGRAVGVVLAIVLGSFFLNFISQFWNPAKSLAFLGVLNYYRPLMILRNGAWPVADISTLVGVGGVAWLFGGIIFARRDIRTT